MILTFFFIFAAAAIFSCPHRILNQYASENLDPDTDQSWTFLGKAQLGVVSYTSPHINHRSICHRLPTIHKRDRQTTDFMMAICKPYFVWSHKNVVSG